MATLHQKENIPILCVHFPQFWRKIFSFFHNMQRFQYAARTLSHVPMPAIALLLSYHFYMKNSQTQAAQ
ncbi:MAG: hypothetical protein Q4D42_11030, partial [Eubacteriales bacterium]|nr:hypothetical protein [Eubacteriales bacterium]